VAAACCANDKKEFGLNIGSTKIHEQEIFAARKQVRDQ